jgi:hypothetical protein
MVYWQSQVRNQCGLVLGKLVGGLRFQSEKIKFGNLSKTYRYLTLNIPGIPVGTVHKNLVLINLQ